MAEPRLGANAPVYEQVEEPNRADPVLCYVDEPWAFFTTRKLDEQWGDDWDDAPYEHNAGTPYEPYRSALRGPLVDGKLTPVTQYDGERPGWSIVRVAYRCELEEPRGNHLNSPYCVRDINAGAVPWLSSPSWSSSEKRTYINAGTPLSKFIRMIQDAGGEVYMEIPSDRI